MKLYISTFGRFDIISEDQSLIVESGRTYKLFKLFQYFLTFRNQKLLPETIIENLWSDSESVDPKNMLRTQIFRLRQVIKSLMPNENMSDYLNINFMNGYYCLVTGENTIVDADEFESLVNQYEGLNDKESDKAALICENLTQIYKGPYLSDNAYEVWLIPARNYYHRLFLKTLYNLLEILSVKGDNEKIVALCEKSLIIEPYEEKIHIYMIESMLKLGQIKSAGSHYGYAFTLLKREMGTQPSDEFIRLSKKIQDNNFYKEKTDIYSIRGNLENFKVHGAVYCDLDYFKFLFNIQKRKALRIKQRDYLCVLTFTYLKNTYDLDEYKNSALLKRHILADSLRKGDVFTFWNDNQILILLYDVKNEGLDSLKNRIGKKFKECAELSAYKLDIMFQPLDSDEAVI